VAIRTRVADMAARWRSQGYDLHLGIGVAEGYATIGAIGFEGRWDYGAIGTVTNLASRLCAEAQPGQILVSERVHARVADFLTVEELPPLPLKGFKRPVVAYSVTGVQSGP
jgi:class 3 adenylate cyclase